MGPKSKRPGLKLEWLLLALTAGLLAAIAAAFALGEVPNGHGYPDAAFATLQLGGDGPGRLARVLWLGWLIGALQIAFFMGCLALGLRRRLPPDATPAPWRRTLLWGGLGFEGVWTALVAVYWRYATSGSTEIWLGLPAPTAIMLYGIWLFPVVFCLLYVIRFDRWVMSEEDLARFHELVQRTRREDKQSP